MENKTFISLKLLHFPSHLLMLLRKKNNDHDGIGSDSTHSSHKFFMQSTSEPALWSSL